MDYKKSIYLRPISSSNRLFKKQLTIQNKNNNDKRKSDDIFINNYLNKLKNLQKDKINKIPVDHRMSCQNKNLLISSIMLQNSNNNESKEVKDNNYYINLLKNIYINDSHLTNKNIVKNNLGDSINILKRFEKKKTYNYSKGRNSKDSSIKRSTNKHSKKKLSFNSNDIKKEINKKKTISSNDKKKQNKKFLNLNDLNKNNKENNDNNDNNDNNKFLSEKIISKIQDKKGFQKIKNNDSSNNNSKKFKSSRNVSKNKDTEIMNTSLKDEKDIENIRTNQKDIKLKIDNNNQKQKERKRSNNHDVEKEEIEIEKCDTKNNSNKNNSKNNEIIENKENKDNTIKNDKKSKISCLFCCFSIKEDD